MYAADELTSLTNLADGAAVELFDMALEDAIKNIEDLNRDPKAKREITLKVTLVPTENQGMIAVYIDCTPKLAARKTINALLMFGRNNGRLETRELHKQMELPFTDGSKITSIAREKEDR